MQHISTTVFIWLWRRETSRGMGCWCAHHANITLPSWGSFHSWSLIKCWASGFIFRKAIRSLNLWPWSWQTWHASAIRGLV